jgi:hypothetical protein
MVQEIGTNLPRARYGSANGSMQPGPWFLGLLTVVLMGTASSPRWGRL